MDTRDYTKREIDILFGEIKESLERIEIQTTKTNGNVASLKIWKGYLTGAISVIVISGIPILGYLATQLFDTQLAVSHLQGMINIASVSQTK